MISEVDFVSIPTSDLARAVAFYGDTLGLRCSVHMPERNFAEFETDNVTLSVMNPQAMGIGPVQPNTNFIALRVDDVAAARERLEAAGVQFERDNFDTGVCHMAFLRDPDGNALMLHHRYAPRETDG